jgi:undecaprenyl-diphosphatase
MGAWLYQWDVSILEFLNSFSQRSWLFDQVVSALEGEALFKGGILTAFLWWGWFRDSSKKEVERAILIAGTISAIVSLAVCRVLAYILPYRERPVFVPELHFRLPLGVDPSTLITWSSFPSDHAGLFFSLATTLFFISRRAGIAAGIYTALFVCFPRVYTGFHFPTDILAGAVIGIAVTSLILQHTIRDMLAKQPLRIFRARPVVFYVLAYLGSLLLTTNFDVIRRVGAVVFRGLRTRSGM